MNSLNVWCQELNLFASMERMDNIAYMCENWDDEVDAEENDPDNWAWKVKLVMQSRSII